MKDKIIGNRPRFKNKDLEKFEKDMQTIEWDNKPGEGILSDEAISSIANKIINSSDGESKENINIKREN